MIWTFKMKFLIKCLTTLFPTSTQCVQQYVDRDSFNSFTNGQSNYHLKQRCLICVGGSSPFFIPNNIVSLWHSHLEPTQVTVCRTAPSALRAVRIAPKMKENWKTILFFFRTAPDPGRLTSSLLMNCVTLMRVLSYLSRVRKSVPRRPSVTFILVVRDLIVFATHKDLLDQLLYPWEPDSLITDSRARRPCPVMQTSYIYLFPPLLIRWSPVHVFPNFRVKNLALLFKSC